MKSIYKIILIMATAALLLAACGAQPAEDLVATSVHLTTSAMQVEEQQSAPDPTATTAEEPTAEAPTEAPPEPTATPEPSATTEPTTAPPTEAPTKTELPDDGRVIFDTGTTFSTIFNTIEENSTNEYIVNIQAGQMLSAFIESDGKTPSLAIFDESGKEILAASKGFTWYLTTVQKTQDYTIRSVSADFTSEYILHLSTPIDVEFDAGATSKTYEGVLLADDIIEYKAYALQNQKAKVTLTSTSGAARLFIYGLSSGETYVNYSDNAATWELTLPESQTYLIRVLANNADALYTLTVEFTN
jgi:hypothetical protein